VYNNYPADTVRRTVTTTDPYSRTSPTRDYGGGNRLTNDVLPHYGSTDVNPNRDVSLYIQIHSQITLISVGTFITNLI
jgi:hypothetical protein